MTASLPLSCPCCQGDLSAGLASPGTPTACRKCARPVEGLVFPAFHRPVPAGKAAEALVAVEDAGCFYHPQSRAQVPCDACGRFLCALCDVELQGQHLCPSCLNSGRQKKEIQQLDSSRVLYGGIAFLLALLPIIALWPLTIVTAPLALFVALYGWKKPLSLTGKGRATYVIAIVLALLQIAAWALLFAGLNFF